MWVPIGVRYGLDVQEFYSLNPARLERYQPFLQERLKQKNEGISEVGWVNGLYVSRAIGGALPKGKRYPDVPIKIYDSSNDNPDGEEEKQEPFTDADNFAAFAAVFNKRRSDLKPINEMKGAPDESAETIGGDEP